MGFTKNNAVYSVEYNKSIYDRQFLRIKKYPTTNNPVVVIMKNPSKTCNNMPSGNQIITKKASLKKCHIDRTTGIVLRKLFYLGYDEIIILNLYSYYSTNPLNINSVYYSPNTLPNIFYQNNNLITYFLNNYRGNIICAWGSNSGIQLNGYNSQINTIMTAFNSNHNLLEFDATTKAFLQLSSVYPLHGLKWK